MKVLLAFFVGLTHSPASPAPSASPWGGDGHRLICEIAWRHLTPEAKRLVDDLRQGEPGTFAQSCTWADEVRPDRPETSAFHFINIKSGAAGVDLQRDCADPVKRCVVWAIKHYAYVLGNNAMARSERAEALKFIGHFVGDLHQPLHAGRLEDLGGNNIRVAFFGDRGTERSAMNLHRVWDSAIAQRAQLSYPAAADALTAQITSVQAVQWSNTDVIAWTNESFRLAEDFVYSVANGGEIGDPYYDRAATIVRQRIQQAGIRLAFLLNEVARGGAQFTY